MLRLCNNIVRTTFLCGLFFIVVFIECDIVIIIVPISIVPYDCIIIIIGFFIVVFVECDIVIIIVSFLFFSFKALPSLCFRIKQIIFKKFEVESTRNIEDIPVCCNKRGHRKEKRVPCFLEEKLHRQFFYEENHSF